MTSLLEIAKDIKKALEVALKEGTEIDVWSYDTTNSDFTQTKITLKQKTNLSYEVQKFFIFNEGKCKGNDMSMFKNHTIYIPVGDYSHLFKTIDSFEFLSQFADIKMNL